MGKGESGCGAPGDGTRISGSEMVECRRPPRVRKPEEAWRQAFLTEKTQDWMLAQDRKRQWQVTLVKPGVWRIDDYFYSLLLSGGGNGKSGAGGYRHGRGRPDRPAFAALTRLPVELAVTHPHGDHMYHAERFSRVYLHENDIARLQEAPQQFRTLFLQTAKACRSSVPLERAAALELGGGVVLEVAELSGHAGFRGFIDDAHRALYTGDAVGSGLYRPDDLPGRGTGADCFRLSGGPGEI